MSTSTYSSSKCLKDCYHLWLVWEKTTTCCRDFLITLAFWVHSELFWWLECESFTWCLRPLCLHLHHSLAEDRTGRTPPATWVIGMSKHITSTTLLKISLALSPSLFLTTTHLPTYLSAIALWVSGHYSPVFPTFVTLQAAFLEQREQTVMTPFTAWSLNTVLSL